jgi:uncharacterized protein (UPF0333 family)
MLTLQKGEISTEFIFLIGLILIFFVIIIIVVGIKNRDITESMVYTDSQRLSDIIASEINTAARINGYYREIDLPSKLVNGENYSVLINTNFRFVEVVWGEGRGTTSKIVTGNVSGTAKPGVNRIRNSGGLIIIES